MKHLKLLNWNVAGRTRVLPEQIAAVVRREPDLAALQEIRASTLPSWSDALAREGLVSCVDSSTRAGGRRLFNLTASRWELAELPPLVAPQPERVLSVVAKSPHGQIEIHNAHIPPAPSNGVIKVETCEKLFERLAQRSAVHRILCGDLNTPRHETEEGTIETFASNRPDCEARWDAAERSLLVGLGEWGLVDSFREINGYGRRDVSWVMRSRYGRRSAHRLDHVLASPQLGVVDCDYIHGWREAGLSDHSAMETLFAPP
jgi:exonuclease III